MHPVEPLTFNEFGEYVVYLAETSIDDVRTLRLPKTEFEFENWWRRICLSDELRDRWTRRIRLRERYLQILVEEIAAIGRA